MPKRIAAFVIWALAIGCEVGAIYCFNKMSILWPVLAFIIADAVLAYDTNKKQPGKYEVMPNPLADEVVAVAFRKDDKELIAKIDKALDEMKKDGTAKKICEQWLGADMIKYEK